MNNYVFSELSDKEYSSFVEKSSQNNFMQTIHMRDYYELKKSEHYVVGVKEDKKIVAAALICLESKYKKYKKFAIYKGPIMDYNNKELLTFFTKSINNYLKGKDAYMYTIDPNIIQIERDSDAQETENAKNNFEAIDILKKLGYFKSEKDLQIKWTYAIDINSRSSDELFKSFKQNTRNIISKTITKYKLNVRNLSLDQLDEFKKITESTCKRRGFNDKTMAYYQNMIASFKDNVVFKLAELNCDKYLEDLYLEKKDYEEKIEKIVGNKKKKDNYIENLNYVNNSIKEIEELKEKEGNIIPLACAMFITYGDEVIYFSSGSYDEYMKYYGQYLIQWDMIKYACDNKYKRYNFYGIMDVFNNKGKDYGVYKFKKGFNGYVRELLGEYSYVINNKIYRRYNLLSKIKRLLKH